jgi:3-hydroxyisobutyrate dehydrogenase
MTNAQKTETVGVIGSGEFGPAIRKRMAACHVATISESGPAGHVADKIASAQNWDRPVVFAAIEDTRTFRSMLQGEEPGMAFDLEMGSVLIDLGPRTPRELATLVDLLEPRDVTLVDAAIIGGPEATADGHARILLGGEGEALNAAEAVMQMLGNVERTGPLGSAHAAAALMGYVEAANAVARHEAAAFGSACGLSADLVARVLSETAAAGGSNVLTFARRAARPRTPLARTPLRNPGRDAETTNADVIDLTAARHARARRENS